MSASTQENSWSPLEPRKVTARHPRQSTKVSGQIEFNRPVDDEWATAFNDSMRQPWGEEAPIPKAANSVVYFDGVERTVVAQFFPAVNERIKSTNGLIEEAIAQRNQERADQERRDAEVQHEIEQILGL